MANREFPAVAAIEPIVKFGRILPLRMQQNRLKLVERLRQPREIAMAKCGARSTAIMQMRHECSATLARCPSLAKPLR